MSELEVEQLRRQLEQMRLDYAKEVVHNLQLRQLQQCLVPDHNTSRHTVLVIQYPSNSSCQRQPYCCNLFLGGQNSGDRWQQKLIEKIQRSATGKRNVCIYNPYGIDSQEISKKSKSTNDAATVTRDSQQHLWELEHLDKSNGAVFWFPWDHDKSKIGAYLQLGSCSHSGKHVFVGIHARHPSKKAIYEYIKLYVPNAVVTSSFDKLTCYVVDWIITGKKSDNNGSGSGSNKS
jgi:hypothetical protein